MALILLLLLYCVRRGKTRRTKPRQSTSRQSVHALHLKTATKNIEAVMTKRVAVTTNRLNNYPNGNIDNQGFVPTPFFVG